MNLSGKKGQKVPEMVRRALAISQGPDQDLSSSISSCQSNIDNIKPPTDMDSSFLSIASISSEIAEMNNSTEGKLKVQIWANFVSWFGKKSRFWPLSIG